MEVPWFIQRAPRIFYAAAIIWIAWSIALPYFQFAQMGWSPQLNGAGETGGFVILEIASRAMLDAVFLVGVGVNAQILLYILGRTQRGAGQPGSEA